MRYCGTIGGNVANGDPANDMPAVMQCLDASYVLRGADGERQVAARDFYEGTFFTALGDGELLTAIRIPTPPAGHGHAYEKLKRKVGDSHSDPRPAPIHRYRHFRSLCHLPFPRSGLTGVYHSSKGAGVDSHEEPKM